MSARRCLSAGRRRGFTLTELMVVIAIIAVLVSILMPVLSQVRRSQNEIVSLSRMRDLAMFTIHFASEHRDRFPRSQHSAFANRAMPWEYAFYVSVEGDRGYRDSTRWGEFVDRLLRCPFDPREGAHPSFGLNVYFELTPEESGDRPWRMTSTIPSPTKTVMYGPLEEASITDHIMAHFWSQIGPEEHEVAADRYGDEAGYAFVDGHVGTAPFTRLYDPSEGIDHWNPATAR